MGRFYKTAKPTFVDDIIYQAPYELMAAALQAQDKNIDNKKETIDGLSVLADLKKYNDSDKEERNRRIDKIRDRANSLTEKIYKNPALANTYQAEINKLKREVEADMKTGFFNDAERNYEKRTKGLAEINARKGINADQKQTAIALLDYNDKGSLNGGEYTENLPIYDEVTQTDVMKDYKSLLTPDKISTKEDVHEGDYIRTQGKTTTYYKAGRLEDIYNNSEAVQKWKRMTLQNMEYKYRAENLVDDKTGETIDNPDALGNAFLDKEKAFKKNFMSTLGFEQITPHAGLKVDSAKVAAKNRALQRERMNKDLIAGLDVVIDLEESPATENTTLTRDEITNNNNNVRGKAVENLIGEDNLKSYTNLFSEDKDKNKNSRNRLVVELMTKDKELGKEEAKILVNSYMSMKKNKNIKLNAVIPTKEIKSRKVAYMSQDSTEMVWLERTNPKTGKTSRTQMPRVEAQKIQAGHHIEEVKEMVTSVNSAGEVLDGKGNPIQATASSKDFLKIEDYVEGEVYYRNTTAAKTEKIKKVKVQNEVSTKGLVFHTSEEEFNYKTYGGRPTSIKTNVSSRQLSNGEVIRISEPIKRVTIK